MSQFFVSTDDSLGEERTADDPVSAARDFAAAKGLAAGSVVTVRWNLRFHPRDPSMLLSASVRDVTVEAARVPAAESPAASEAAPPEGAQPAKGRKAKAEAKSAEPPAAPAPTEGGT